MITKEISNIISVDLLPVKFYQLMDFTGILMLKKAPG